MHDTVIIMFNFVINSIKIKKKINMSNLKTKRQVYSTEIGIFIGTRYKYCTALCPGFPMFGEHTIARMPILQ